MDRESHRAAVEAGYASLAEYIEKWEPTMVEATQKRYADDVTLQEIVRLRVENNHLREALDLLVVYWDKWMDRDDDPLALSLEEVVSIARSALQQKDSKS